MLTTSRSIQICRVIQRLVSWFAHRIMDFKYDFLYHHLSKSEASDGSEASDDLRDLDIDIYSMREPVMKEHINCAVWDELNYCREEEGCIVLNWNTDYQVLAENYIEAESLEVLEGLIRDGYIDLGEAEMHSISIVNDFSEPLDPDEAIVGLKEELRDGNDRLFSGAEYTTGATFVYINPNTITLLIILNSRDRNG